jgi:hypothetical protein
MLVFRYEVHQYVGDQKLDARRAHDLKQDALHVDDQKMDALYDLLSGVRRDQMMDALYDLLLVVHCDQYVVKMNEYLMNVALKCVTCRLLALMNENVRILELQYFHQLAFQHVA